MPVDYLKTHDGQLDQFLEKECAILLPIFHLIDQLHGQYFADRKKPTRPLEVVEIIAAAVHPLYYNRGLLNMVCHFCLANGREKTPEDLMILLEPTGAFSQVSRIRSNLCTCHLNQYNLLMAYDGIYRLQVSR